MERAEQKKKTTKARTGDRRRVETLMLVRKASSTNWLTLPLKSRAFRERILGSSRRGVKFFLIWSICSLKTHRASSVAIPLDLTFLGPRGRLWLQRALIRYVSSFPNLRCCRNSILFDPEAMMDLIRLLGQRAALAAAFAATAAGCNSDVPFAIVPVHGKVTYEDGSLIEADSILLAFNPAAPATGPITAPGGTARVNVSDGTFAAVTTRRTDDGIVPGVYKVVVVPFKKDGKGNPKPTAAVPAKFQKESTTPLEVEVSSADQLIELKVSKP